MIGSRKLHKSYREDFGSDYHYRTLKRFSEILKPYTGLVLDIGCGEGHIRNYISENVEYVGIDFNNDYLSFLWKGLKRDNRIVGDVCHLPFRDEVADVCINLHVIEHLFQEQQPKLVAELFRTLKKNGALVLSTPNLGTLFHSDWFTPPHNPKHFHCINYGTLKGLLCDAGFCNIRRFGFDLFIKYPHPFFKYLPYFIRRFLVSIFLCLDKYLLITAQKKKVM